MLDREIEEFSRHGGETFTQQVAVIQKDRISLLNPLNGVVQETF